MRELSPVGTIGTPGYYSNEDLRMQMIVYGDITPWRCARMMRIAEEEAAKERMTLILTENDQVQRLALSGFLIYRPASQGLNAVVDVAQIVYALATSRKVVINTNELEDEDRFALSRELVRALSTMKLGALSMIVESTEQFFARRWNYGRKSGMPTLNNLLKRAKSEGAHIAFAAESPQEMAVEIGRSCGTAIVGRMTNHDRVKATSASVDKRILRHANALYGIKAQNPDDFYLFNHNTAPRQGPDQGVLPIETPVSILALTQSVTMPVWLRDSKTECGFDPADPTPPPDFQSDEQTRFEEDMQKAREEADAAADPAGPQTEPSRVAASAAPAAPSHAAPSPVANDNGPPRGARTARSRPCARKRFTEAPNAAARIRAAGLQNADRLVSIGVRVLNARGGRLNAPLSARITAATLARRIIDETDLRDAILTGVAVAHRHRATPGLVVSATALAAACHQAMREDPAVGRRFMREMFLDGVRSGTRRAQALDLDAALRQLGTETDGDRRAESQYQMVRSAWTVFRAANAVTPRAA